MLYLFLIFFLLLLFFLSFFLFWKINSFQKIKIEIEKELALALQKNEILENQLKVHQSKIDQLNQEVLCEKERVVGSQTKLSLLEQHLDNEKKNMEQYLNNEKKNFEHLKNEMERVFQSLAHRTLETNSQHFLQVTKELLNKEKQLAQSDLDKRQSAIQTLLAPVQETLIKYHHHTMELEKERQRSYATIEQELKRVVETGEGLKSQTQALKDALKRPHVRGRWGEIQLKNCVELAGMSEFADVSFQDSSISSEGRRLIPDMTVRMPGGRVVIVDAKTPIEAFLAALEAPTDQEKSAQMVRHGKHVKEHIIKLSAKEYATECGPSADFIVMFLPNESFLYAALEYETDLVEFALQRKILIATPPTFVGLLKVIRFGWNEEKLTRNAEQISLAAKELHKRVADFVDSFMNIGKFLDKARNEFDIGYKRLQSRVLVQARRMEELGAKGSRELPNFSEPSLTESLTSHESNGEISS